MNEKLKGVIIPCATPFDHDGNVSESMMEHNYGMWAATGIKGLMCLASNGEFRSLSDDESISVIKTAARLKADKTLIAGAARESVRQTADFIKRIEDSCEGVDYLALLTPGYFAKLMTDTALIDYYVSAAEISSVPVLIYVAPGFANGVRVSPEALKILADHPNIQGIKDTSPDMLEKYLEAAGGREDFSVIAGSINTLLRCISGGGTGGIVSAANYFPAECAKITELFFDGRLEEAEKQNTYVRSLASSTGAKYSVAGVKACMDIMGFKGGAPRRPIQPITPAQYAELENTIREAGLIK